MARCETHLEYEIQVVLVHGPCEIYLEYDYEIQVVLVHGPL